MEQACAAAAPLGECANLPDSILYSINITVVCYFLEQQGCNLFSDTFLIWYESHGIDLGLCPFKHDIARFCLA